MPESALPSILEVVYFMQLFSNNVSALFYDILIRKEIKICPSAPLSIDRPNKCSHLLLAAHHWAFRLNSSSTEQNRTEQKHSFYTDIRHVLSRAPYNQELLVSPHAVPTLPQASENPVYITEDIDLFSLRMSVYKQQLFEIIFVWVIFTHTTFPENHLVTGWGTWNSSVHSTQFKKVEFFHGIN